MKERQRECILLVFLWQIKIYVFHFRISASMWLQVGGLGGYILSYAMQNNTHRNTHYMIYFTLHAVQVHIYII